MRRLSRYSPAQKKCTSPEPVHVAGFLFWPKKKVLVPNIYRSNLASHLNARSHLREKLDRIATLFSFHVSSFTRTTTYEPPLAVRQ